MEFTNPRIKECQMIVPKKPNHELAADYEMSKHFSKQYKRNFDGDDMAGRVDLELLHTKMNLKAAEEVLEKKREFARGERVKLDKQWAELQEKEEELRKNFIKFHNFIKENEVKRARALVKLEEQQEIKRSREKNIDDLRKQYNDLMDLRDRMQNKIKEHSIYEAYLNSVCAKYPEFNSISDILRRYDSLIDAKMTLAESQKTILTNLENARNELLKRHAYYNEVLMNMRRRVSSLMERLKHVKEIKLHSEELMHEVLETTQRMRNESVEVQGAIQAMYKQMRSRYFSTKTKEEEALISVEDMMEFISTAFIRQKHLFKECQRFSKPDFTACMSEIGFKGRK